MSAQEEDASTSPTLSHPSSPPKQSQKQSLLNKLLHILGCISDNSLPDTPQQQPVVSTEQKQVPVPVLVEPQPAPEQQEEEEVILQPTPSLLPVSETEGVTSGAVQPPGSTGAIIIQEKQHNHPSDNDSDRTSFTEEDDLDGIDEQEDDEDKLILSGGAGIPVGPVRSLPFPLITR